jgi:hypothetical protein
VDGDGKEGVVGVGDVDAVDTRMLVERFHAGVQRHERLRKVQMELSCRGDVRGSTARREGRSGDRHRDGLRRAGEAVDARSDGDDDADTQRVIELVPRQPGLLALRSGDDAVLPFGDCGKDTKGARHPDSWFGGPVGGSPERTVRMGCDHRRAAQGAQPNTSIVR